jgi:hypothetical protein
VNQRVATSALWGLLLVLALRMTMTETLRETLSQITGQAAAQTAGAGLPEIGPAVTTGLAAITFLLAGMAAWCAATAGALSRTRMGRLAIVIAVLVLGAASTFLAANRFLALVGWCDLGMALLAGWSVGLLCDSRLLGMAARRTVIAAVVALLAVWTAKGIYQRVIDIPETIKYYNLHRDEALAQALGSSQSTDKNSPEVKLFESRMNSKEVTGFVTLSDVMATGMVGLLAVRAGLGATRIVDPLVNEESDERDRNRNEISWPLLNTSLTILLGLAGLMVLFLTVSLGGSLMGVAAVSVIVAGAFCWRWIVARRRIILAAAAMAVLLGAAALIGYGVIRDTLPMKTLMFRWHYWTASAAMVKQSPLLGVGLNNFGDYYTSVKRASSPEDVKDPHSFFVRIATETGVPAALLIGALIVWLLLAATDAHEHETESPWNVRNAVASGLVFCGLWWLLHQLLAEPSDQYSLILSVLSAIIAIAAWAMACGMLSFCGGRGVRFIAIAGVVGALAMLVYDQITMALVTGPVAMFFWMLLGMGESWSTPVVRPSRLSVLADKSGGAILLATGVVIAAVVWWPTLRGGGAMPWDPLPYELRYVQAVQESPPDFVTAKAALDQALARSPRSTDLLRQRVLVNLQLHEPVAQDIHAILALDRTSARLRMSLAMGESELSPSERIAILEEAVRLDAQLPKDEITRLTPQDHAAIEAEIAALQKSETAK